MKNSGVVAVMTFDIPDCEEGLKHNWLICSRPEENKSGYYTEKCTNCGLVYQYDTSD